MTQPEIDQLAIDLGITREAWPEFWQLTGSTHKNAKHICTLPAPDSDYPARNCGRIG